MDSVHLGSRVSHSFHVPGDDAGLPAGEMAELVSLHLLHIDDLDQFLQLHHGVDDHDYRYRYYLNEIDNKR